MVAGPLTRLQSPSLPAHADVTPGSRDAADVPRTPRAVTGVGSRRVGVYMATGNDVDRFLSQLDAAITTATGRLGSMSMRVAKVRVTFKTVLDKNVEGKLDLRIVSFDAAGGTQHASEVTVEFVPRGLVPAGGIEGELIDGLETVAAAVDALAERFDVRDASVDLAFTTTAEGTVRLIVGGGVSHADTHKATVTLEPVE